MKRVRLLAQGLCLILATSLLISCGVASVAVAPTATPEPPAPTPTPTATPTGAPTGAPTATPTATPELPAPTSTEGQRPTTKSEVPRISPEALKERLDNGEAILIVDARSPVEFETQHIAGAISVPSNEVEARLDEFPRDQEIVFY